MAIANARYQRNRSRKFRHVTQAAKRRIWYCSYEPGTQGRRGEWFDRDGHPQSYEQVQTWAREQAGEHAYMYTLVLSVEKGLRPTTEQFNAAMREGGTFSDWRIIQHGDKPNAHAHVIAFTDKTLRRDELVQWQQGTCRALEVLEQHLQREQQREAMHEQMMEEEGGLEL